MSVRHGVTVRGVSNGNERGSAEGRRRRKAWLCETYAADQPLTRVEWSWGDVTFASYTAETLREYESVVTAEYVPTCRCYRCGRLLTNAEDAPEEQRVTADRIIPGCQGGTYRRTNIRPACGGCNSETGGALAAAKIKKTAKVRRGHNREPVG